MAINKGDMAKAIQSEFDAVTQATKWSDGERPADGAYNTAFDKAISEYIANNLVITYSWSAMLPPPASAPDPVISFTASVSFSNFKIGTPSSFADWGAMIQKEILAGTIKQDNALFILGTLSFLEISLVLVQGGDIENICGQICTWLKKCINPAPVSGTHAAYTVPSPGAIMTVIS